MWFSIHGYATGELNDTIAARDALIHPDQQARIKATMRDFLAELAERKQTEPTLCELNSRLVSRGE